MALGGTLGSHDVSFPVCKISQASSCEPRIFVEDPLHPSGSGTDRPAFVAVLILAKSWVFRPLHPMSPFKLGGFFASCNSLLNLYLDVPGS